MLHIAQMIEKASDAVSQIKVIQDRCLMAIMTDDTLTQEQKMHIVSKLKPIDDAIDEAQDAFSYDVK